MKLFIISGFLHFFLFSLMGVTNLDYMYKFMLLYAILNFFLC